MTELEFERLNLFSQPGTTIWCHAHKSNQQEQSMLPSFDLHLFDEDGTAVADLINLRVRLANQETLLANQTDDWLYEIAWQGRPRACTEKERAGAESGSLQSNFISQQSSPMHCLFRGGKAKRMRSIKSL